MFSIKWSLITLIMSLTWSTGCSPLGSSSCDIQDRPQSTLRPGWQNWSGLDSWERILDCGWSFGFTHLYIFYPLEALVEREVVPNCVLKLLPRLEFVSRTLQNQLPICLFSPFSARLASKPNCPAGSDLALRWKERAQFAISIKLSACNWYIYVCRKKGVKSHPCSPGSLPLSLSLLLGFYWRWRYIWIRVL